MLDDLKYVNENSEYVHINMDKLKDFASNLDNLNYVHWTNEMNLGLSEKEMILLVFIIESMNFCFWELPKWKISYKDEVYTGSNALFYTIIKQVENNKEFLKIDNLLNIDKVSFNKIFEGEGICPLLEERYNCFKEVISYFSNNNVYDELFSFKTDLELMNYVITNFKYFDDKSMYKDRLIHFNKRATLLLNDLYYVSPTIRNNIGNVNNLGGCADYGIPRTFRDYGILEYNEELRNTIDNEIEIPHDSNMEIEIRANMLYVIELLRIDLKEKGIIINSVELDYLIWWMGKESKDRSKSHHTRTIYY